MNLKRTMACAAACTALVALAVPADAKHNRRVHGYKTYSDSSPSYGYRSSGYYGNRRGETMTDILANQRDPAGNYRGYPNWARSAFGRCARAISQAIFRPAMAESGP